MLSAVINALCYVRLPLPLPGYPCPLEYMKNPHRGGDAGGAAFPSLGGGYGGMSQKRSGRHGHRVSDEGGRGGKAEEWGNKNKKF